MDWGAFGMGYGYDGLYVKRVFRQHGSLVVTLPVAMARVLCIERGDYVVFEVKHGRKSASFYRWRRGVSRVRADYGSAYLPDSQRRIHAARED